MRVLNGYTAALVFLIAFFFSCNSSSNSNNTESSVSVSGDKSQIAKASLAIEGMTCEMGCAKMIEKKLAKLDGMEEAKVNFDEHTAYITYNSSKINENLLRETIESLHGGDSYKLNELKVLSNNTTEEKSTSTNVNTGSLVKDDPQMKSRTISFPNIFGLLERFIPAK